MSSSLCTGTLPSQWGAFGAFNNLTSMSCHNCSLSGSLPPDWGPGLSMLASLDLQNNSLTGVLPYNWSTNSFMVCFCLTPVASLSPAAITCSLRNSSSCRKAMRCV